MNRRDLHRVKELQERINSLLKATPEDRRASNFSDYRPDNSPAIVDRLTLAAEPGGIEGIEAALDEFERLRREEDVLRMQHALMLFLTHHPAVSELGLRIPSLQERAPWKVLPGKRN